jgi:hypothetical protein
MLPSQVIANATTFDIMVMDVMATWQDHKNNPNKIENYKTEDLEKILKETKS